VARLSQAGRASACADALIVNTRIRGTPGRRCRSIPCGTVRACVRRLVGFGELDQRLQEHGFIDAVAVEPRAPFQAVARDLQRAQGKLAHGFAAERKFQCVLRHAVAQRVAFGHREIFHQIPRGIQRLYVVQQADPERGQRA
jgi:hypothetical protein